MSHERNDGWTPLLKSYPDSDKINRVSLGAETLFTRLLAASDDNGNYYGSATQLLCRLYSIRFERGEVSLADLERWRDELVTQALLTRYEAGGSEYLHIINVKKGVRKDVKRKVDFPELPENKEVTESVTDAGRTRAATETNTGLYNKNKNNNKNHNHNQNNTKKGTKTGGKPSLQIAWLQFNEQVMEVYTGAWSQAERTTFKGIFQEHFESLESDEEWTQRISDLRELAEKSRTRDNPKAWFNSEQKRRYSPETQDVLDGL